MGSRWQEIWQEISLFWVFLLWQWIKFKTMLMTMKIVIAMKWMRSQIYNIHPSHKWLIIASLQISVNITFIGNFCYSFIWSKLDNNRNQCIHIICYLFIYLFKHVLLNLTWSVVYKKQSKFQKIYFQHD